MTSKTLEKLFDLYSQLSNIKTDFKEHPATKSRFGSLVITKLEEAIHWLDDLIVEVARKGEEEK